MTKTFIGKECPFCGNTKLSVDCKSKNEFEGCKRTYTVRCNSCFARGGTVSGFVKKNYYCHQEVTIISDDELINKAIKLWNKRV